MKTTISDIGESRIIDTIRKILGVPQCYSNEVIKTSCDLEEDACVLELSDNNCIVVCTDMINQGVEFLDDTNPQYVGYIAVTVVVSDIVAMGAKPVGVGIAWGVPEQTSTSKLKQIAYGIRKALNEYNVRFIAGDFNACKELTLSGVGIGVARRHEIVYRRGAKIGDYVAVTGELGGYTAGYYLEKYRPDVWNFSKNELAQLLTRFHKPKARSKESREMVKAGCLTSMIDLSDGLLRGLNLISKLNGVGILVEEDRIPLMQSAIKIAEEIGRPCPDFLLSGEGGDYELMITCSPNDFAKLKTAVGQVGNKLTQIGIITEDKGVRFMKSGAHRPIIINDSGFEHFRKQGLD